METQTPSHTVSTLSPEPITAATPVFFEILRTAREMTGWLKFLGAVSFLYGALLAVTIVGLVIAWLPLWMGVLLFQAGAAAEKGYDQDLLTMMMKFKTYFMVQGVLIIVSLVVGLLAMMIAGTAMLAFLSEMGNF